MVSEPSSAAEAAFIPLEDPQAGQKRKREKDSAAAIHKRRKGGRNEKAKTNVQLPHPSTVQQAESAENGIHADRMRMINQSGSMVSGQLFYNDIVISLLTVANSLTALSNQSQ